VWTTSVLLNGSFGCPAQLTYQLATFQPDSVTPATAPLVEHLEANCHDQAGGYEVSLQFRPPDSFLSTATGPVLVITQRQGKASAAVPLTVRRLVTSWQYLWLPLIYAAAMPMLFLYCVVLTSRVGALRGNAFWRRPLRASAAWTLNGSLLTNIAVAATVILGFLTTSSALSSLFPGIQLGRFTILIFSCGAVIAAAPLVFGILNAIFPESLLTLPDGAVIALPEEEAGSGPCTIAAPAGAVITFPGGAQASRLSGVQSLVQPGAAVSVPPGGVITVASGARVALAAAEKKMIVVGGVSVTPVNAEPTSGGGPAARSGAVVASEAEIGASDATIVFPGTAELRMPKGTELTVHGGRRILRRQTTFLAPGWPRFVSAAMFSVILAAMVTMFGIGAELGLVVVLAGMLADATTKITVFIVVALIFVIALAYAVLVFRLFMDRSNNPRSPRSGLHSPCKPAGQGAKPAQLKPHPDNMQRHPQQGRLRRRPHPHRHAPPRLQ
jgi:hypothetical protein